MKIFRSRIMSWVVIFSLVFSPELLQAMTPAEKLEFIERGEKVIEDFYNPQSPNFFEKKIDEFFSFENLKLVQIQIEKRAKETGKSTKEVLIDVEREECDKFVYKDLSRNLQNIAKEFQVTSGIAFSSNDPFIEAVGAGTLGFLGVLGLTAGSIAVWTALTPVTLTFWSAFMIWVTGSTVGGWGAIQTALAGGPWAWVIVVALVVAVVGGIAYYKYKAEQAQAEQILGIKNHIKANRSIIVANWRKLFH